ncbi:MAG: hypothetical protein A3D96_04375 [Chlamydiae bacterium RIFCSPHIGHO2_12_FULL_44_59]|nr:MAG: hypothetical protein A2796_04150 [Chlamydiae bacterium RIFCSPHIGHO2_01_FULL_44_39]OGN56466.1 MAG: hypothetical protein A3C42_02215 [Chlamydiae bacterium RIFCSPHIGHO2_02_FULL_45_9]OGN60325.1 MAG: hypothetical protein A3D96_04375 [Chlamydiae bacterium RIFCSPHIGHO2_12_FULL_44_59]OGN66308.1 MAG: hypothetical protein A2978_01820 [Chlamydiae bacterium RIFCSPLOWO2_01_FULL_44_52]OGN69259.1 MAG: hypothetical protein A3I67_00680 [Chlamydiae bacterium RIFCSPLOWO2_02_FULL_45_22]OGN70199.1 MAG: hyp
MVWDCYLRQEVRLSRFFGKIGVSCLRYSMGVIYLWYGVLKIVGISPVEELVTRSTYWIRIPHFVIYLGFWEAAIGLCLMVRRMNRVGLYLLFLQLPGTFLPLIFSPEDCFTIFPYGLTLVGQFVFKNVISIAVGLVLVGDLYRK